MQAQNRIPGTFQVPAINIFKEQMLNWANRFNIFVLLDSNGYQDKYSNEPWLFAAGKAGEFTAGENVLESLKDFLKGKNDWLFGHINYEFRVDGKKVPVHPVNIGFPAIYLFQPEVVIRQTGEQVVIETLGTDPAAIFREIMTAEPTHPIPTTGLAIQQKIPRQEYIEILQQLKQHIQRGDCYEINFCQEFFAENASIDPFQVYRQLMQVSPTPFAGFYRLHDKYLLCASPERFIQKKGDRVLSQPIKGTIRRNLEDAAADEQLKLELLNSQKDRSENVMVVDLVRNDLSRICTEGSVQVEELFGIYSFPQVHQMISTITGRLTEGAGLAEVLEAAFPMGSMTGAPKIRVMELIDQYERSNRGIYSGSIGYITPSGDFDFNVVIRSIVYNATSRYLSYQVGGGITFYSDPAREYEECLLKAMAIKKVLQ